jgi:hypothetical protein
MLVQFRLSKEDQERAYQALERSAASNLNMLAKELFLRHLEQTENHQANIEAISHKIDNLQAGLRSLVKLQEGADPGLVMTVQAALFLLMYRVVPVTVRAELDDVFDADAIISFLKED